MVLRAFIAPFLATFFIALFVLLMQFLWKYIDDLVGKGLEWYVVAELLMYTSATLIPLALPLAILVSSIMTFGNLAEHFEIVAAKSAGISLFRLMVPLITVAIFISAFAFYFSNNILPITNLKMGSLLYDVRQQKPALSIKEGVFYSGLDGYSIKVGKKGKDGKTLYDVMVYDHTKSAGNTTVMLAESGRMEMSSDEKYLIVSMFNGRNYEEQGGYSAQKPNKPLLRSSFTEQIVYFDLSTFKLNRTNEELFKDNYQMLNMKQLTLYIDSFDLSLNKRADELVVNLNPYFNFYRDSSVFAGLANKNIEKIDPISTLDVEDSLRIYDHALNQARGVKLYLDNSKDDMEGRQRQINKFNIEWHRKLTLSAACLILFLIGAPLGAIIRKGGFGMPLVVSVIFFLIYHVISITGEKFAKESVMTPLDGMWLSALVLTPIGLFLMYKATHDSSLFDPSYYFGKLGRWLKRSKS